MPYKKRKNTARKRALEKASQFHRAYIDNFTPIDLENFLRKNYDHDIKFSFKAFADCVVVKFEASKPWLVDHPVEVYEGYSMRFNIEPKQALDNLQKYLREKTTNEKVLTP